MNVRLPLRGVCSVDQLRRLVNRRNLNCLCQLLGSLGGGKCRIARINGVEVDFTGEYSTVIVVQQDKPGVVAHITKVLSDKGVNIAFMRLFRESKGNTAYTIVESDGHFPEGIEEPLKNNPNVHDVMIIEP